MGGSRLVHVCKQSCGSYLGELSTLFNWILWFVLHFPDYNKLSSVICHLRTPLTHPYTPVFLGNKRSSNSTVVAGSNGGSEEGVSNVVEATVVEEEAIDNLPSTNLLKGKVPSMQSESKHR